MLQSTADKRQPQTTAVFATLYWYKKFLALPGPLRRTAFPIPLHSRQSRRKLPQSAAPSEDTFRCRQTQFHREAPLPPAFPATRIAAPCPGRKLPPHSLHPAKPQSNTGAAAVEFPPDMPLSTAADNQSKRSAQRHCRCRLPSQPSPLSVHLIIKRGAAKYRRKKSSARNCRIPAFHCFSLMFHAS